MHPIAGGRRSGQCLVENRYMDESEQSDFELLVKILDEELEAQFGMVEHTTPKRPVAYSLHYSQMP